jgi:hypothetical protein
MSRSVNTGLYIPETRLTILYSTPLFPFSQGWRSKQIKKYFKGSYYIFCAKDAQNWPSFAALISTRFPLIGILQTNSAVTVSVASRQPVSSTLSALAFSDVQ